MKKSHKIDRVEITEMFMAQADDDRCFYGMLKRTKDAKGNPHLFSRIVVEDGLINACANDQKELGKKLDEICVMVLDKGLHSNAGVFTTILGEKLYSN